MKIVNHKSDFVENYTDAKIVISKRIYGVIHFVVFRTRPDSQNIGIEKRNKNIYLVVPLDFSPHILYKNVFWWIFTDICMSGKTVLDTQNNIVSLRMYLNVFLKQEIKTNKFRGSILTSISKQTTYLKYLGDFPGSDLLISTTQTIKQLYLSGIKTKNLDLKNDTLERQIPKRIRNVLFSSRKINKESIIRCLDQICIENTYLNNNLFFIISNNQDYEEITNNLFELCSKEIYFLINNCEFYFWFDRKYNRVILKIENVKAHQRELVGCLRKIDSFLIRTSDKKLISPSVFELALIQEEYNIKNAFLSGIEKYILNVYSKKLFKKKNWEDNKILCSVLMEIIREICSKMNTKTRISFLQFLYFHYCVNLYSNMQFKYFNKFNSFLGRNSIRLNESFSFLKIRYSDKKDEIFINKEALTDLVTFFYSKIKRKKKSTRYNLNIRYQLDFYTYSHEISENEIFFFNQSRLLLDKVIFNLGINEETTIIASLAIMNQPLISDHNKSKPLDIA